MTRSAKGTSDNLGRQVRQKSGLNRAILCQGWGIFRDQLSYKQQWRGGDVIQVGPHHTSQTCQYCCHGAKDNRLSQAEFLLSSADMKTMPIMSATSTYWREARYVSQERKQQQGMRGSPVK